MKPYRTGILLLFVTCLMLACANEPKYQSLNFQFDTFDWDSKPYCFSDYIQDSILVSKGPQYASWAYANIGDIENMHNTWDLTGRAIDTLTQSEKDSLNQYIQVDAIEYILKRAADSRVLIINEAHHMPQHRVFTARLIKGLSELGYKHLGLETYFQSDQNDSLLQANGYPTLKSGYYLKEPQFGNMIREALNHSFKVFGYESQGHENGKEREVNQAQNIVDYMGKYPDEKILIHCGFDHGFEGQMPNNWEKAMAGRLKELSGVDPLTINQTTYSERSDRAFENPYMQALDVAVPTILLKDDADIFTYQRSEAYFDMAVVHPRSKSFNRPSWLLYNDKMVYDFDFNDASIDCPCLVLAYEENDDISSAIPLDVQESESKRVKLILKPGQHKILIMNASGSKFLYEENIN